jgi:hypothetical protein
MNCYELVEKDQAKSSWTVFELVRRLPKHPKQPELPPVIYSFFGPQPDGEMRMKERYVSLRCKRCGCYDEDAIYDVGFSDPVTIRIKGDFSTTEDRVFAISKKFHEHLRKAKVRGYETKPLGTTGWHALRVTERVDCDESVMEIIGPFCPKCGRPDRVPGSFTQLKQLSFPAHSNTFFTTRKGWPKPGSSRYIFLTEDVVKGLKAAGIKGGWCSRLWTDDEVRKAEEKANQGAKWKPSGALVSL